MNESVDSTELDIYINTVFKFSLKSNLIEDGELLTWGDALASNNTIKRLM